MLSILTLWTINANDKSAKRVLKGCSRQLTFVGESSLNRHIATFLLLTLVIGYFFLPTQVEAKTVTPLVFKIDKSLSEPRYVNGPLLSEFGNQAKPNPQAKARNTKAVRKVSTGYCSCVLYVKAKIGYTKSVGFARNWPTNSRTPSKGAVIVTYESRSGHVGIVSHFDDTYVYLESEANYSRCKLTYGRKIAINSSIIKGYYVP